MSIDSPPPKSVAISTIFSCNLRCVMCHYSRWQHPASSIDWHDSIRKIVAVWPDSIDNINITGLGELLMQKKFWEVLKLFPYDRDKTPQLMFTTNGTLLTEANIEQMMQANIRRIIISLDSIVPNLYFKIRGIKIDKTLNGIHSLIAAKKNRGGRFPEVAINMTMMKCNLGEVERMLAFAKECGIDMFTAFMLNAYDSSDWKIKWHRKSGDAFSWFASIMRRLFFDTDQYFIYKEQIPVINPDMVDKWVDYADSIQFPAAFGLLKKTDSFGTEARVDEIQWREESIKCNIPFKSFFLNHDNTVTPCCFSQYRLGNLDTQGPTEIWNGKEMQCLRNDLLAGKLPAACKGAACLFAASRSGAEK